MEREIPIYEYKSQLSRNVSDLHSMIHDLKHVLAYLKKLKDGPDDDVCKHALFTASLITYRRCFKHGARVRISYNDIQTISANAKQIHDYIIAQADKFAAHSVNPFEKLFVGVGVENGKVTKIVRASATVEGFKPNSLDQFGGLVSQVLNLLHDKLKVAKDELRKEAEKRPISQIERARRMNWKVPGWKDANKRREN